jgi:hypothetical protein
MKKQTVVLVLVLAALLISAGIYVRSHGLSVTAFIDAHR